MKKARSSSNKKNDRHRWCERYHYFIDLEACKARAVRLPHCRRCLREWQQLAFPFYES